MHMRPCAATLALAILTSAGPATAGDTDMKGGGQNSSSMSRSVAGELFLTSPDKHSIYQGVADDKGQSIPLTFHPMIGARVPDSLALFDLPRKVTNQIPAVKNYQYAKLNSNDVLLVDPKDREVAAVITHQETRSVAGELFLTSPDKHSIYQAVADDKGQSIPLTFHPAIGAKVPDSLALSDLPGKVTDQIPAVKNYQYAKLNSNDVLLVDPKDREVAAVITHQEATRGSN
jgi:hypothetical protein